MIDMLETAIQAALADGYAGLLATGDMTWEFGSEKELSKLLEYEWRLSDTISRLNPHYVRAGSPGERKALMSAGLDNALSVLLAVE